MTNRKTPQIQIEVLNYCTRPRIISHILHSTNTQGERHIIDNLVEKGHLAVGAIMYKHCTRFTYQTTEEGLTYRDRLQSAQWTDDLVTQLCKFSRVSPLRLNRGYKP